MIRLQEASSFLKYYLYQLVSILSLSLKDDSASYLPFSVGRVRPLSLEATLRLHQEEQTSVRTPSLECSDSAAGGGMPAQVQR